MIAMEGWCCRQLNGHPDPDRFSRGMKKHPAF